FWGVWAAFGLATVMSRFAGAFMVLQAVAGLYLLWLAFKAMRSAFTPDMDLSARKIEGSKSFVLQGLAIHLTNPKAVLAWVAILSVGVQPGSPLWQTVVMFAGCVLLGITVFCGYALLFSTQRAQTLYLAARRPIDAGVGVLFGTAGLKLVLDGRTAG
ncbi:MAG: LysE family translocator, partial [Rhizobiaceae bacterium]